MEFGTGDIRMTGALSSDIGALCCITQKPHEIGERVPVEDGWNTDQAEVIMTFTRTEKWIKCRGEFYARRYPKPVERSDNRQYNHSRNR